MDSKNTVGFWVSQLGEKCKSEMDVRLVQSLALEIMMRWKATAALQTIDGLGAEEKFKTFYALCKEDAQTVIVTIVEIIRALGEGKGISEAFMQAKPDKAD
jgi:hypothetical protein